jgi:hypothetical protein
VREWEPGRNDTRRMSQMQRNVLALIADRLQGVSNHRQECTDDRCPCQAMPANCIPWRLGRELSGDGYDWTRARAAVVSRTLKRLEQRGLVIRRNGIMMAMWAFALDLPNLPRGNMGPRRTVMVELTDAGRAAIGTTEANG